MNSSRWLVRAPRKETARIRLYCLPYAGAGASVYRGWDRSLPAYVETCALQLPGRETRLSEPPYHRLDELIPELVEALSADLEFPYALFGHSMGGLIAFEFTRYVQRRGYPGPRHLFVSACAAPALLERRGSAHSLTDEQFIEHIRGLNGTPEGVLANPELLQLLLPCLRADFALFETYRYSVGECITCPVSAFAGLGDSDVLVEEVEAWREEACGDFDFTLVPGGHFLLHSEQSGLLGKITQRLQRSAAEAR